MVGYTETKATPDEVRRASLSFGGTVKRTRTVLGLSAEELAERVGISKSTMYRIENGTLPPTFPRVISLAKSLRVHPSSLLKNIK